MECHADIYNIPCYKKITDYIDKYCDTFDRRGFNSGFCFSASTDIVRKTDVRTESGTVINEEMLKYKDFTLTKYFSNGKDGTKTKHFVEDIEQLDKIL